MWDVVQHQRRLRVRSSDPKATKDPKTAQDWDLFPVYPSLEAQWYENAKFDEHCRAIAIWNGRESSKRHKITVPLNSGAGSQPSQDQ